MKWNWKRTLFFTYEQQIILKTYLDGDLQGALGLTSKEECLAHVNHVAGDRLLRRMLATADPRNGLSREDIVKVFIDAMIAVDTIRMKLWPEG